jgi:hypothetical protein
MNGFNQLKGYKVAPKQLVKVQPVQTAPTKEEAFIEDHIRQFGFAPSDHVLHLRFVEFATRRPR